MRICEEVGRYRYMQALRKGIHRAFRNAEILWRVFENCHHGDWQKSGLEWYKKNADTYNPIRYDRRKIKKRKCSICGREFDPCGTALKVCSPECNKIRKREWQRKADAKRRRRKKPIDGWVLRMAHVFGLYWESHYCVSFFVCNISSRYCHLNISNVPFTIYSEGGWNPNEYIRKTHKRTETGLWPVSERIIIHT